MIQVYRTPIRMDTDAPLEVSVSGEVLSINGADLDLSQVAGPTQLDNPWIVGTAFRMGGDVHVRVLSPYAAGEEPVTPDDMPEPPAPPVTSLPQPRLVATALMTVDAGGLGGVSSAAGLSFGLRMDVGLFWLFFSEEMGDLGYSYAVATSQGRATVTDRQLSYMELTVVDDAGTPLDPSEISLQLYRSN